MNSTNAVVSVLLSIGVLTLCSCVRQSEVAEFIESEPADDSIWIESMPQNTVQQMAIDTILSDCTPSTPELITDFKVLQVPGLSEPAPRTVFRDPVFGTCILRLTDRASDLPLDDPSTGIKNEYSRVQSFNSDGSRILARSIEARWYLYDAQSYQPLGELPLYIEPRWDAVDPDVIYFNDQTQLMAYNIRTGVQSLVHDFSSDLQGQRLSAVWTRYEGRPSADSRYWGLIAEDDRWNPAAFLVYDLQTDQVISQRDLRGLPGIQDGIDHVTMSPLGTYFLASFDRYCEHGQMGDDSNPCGLMVYDRDLDNGRNLLRIIGHYDTALDEQGREVIIYQDIDRDEISMLDLASGNVTSLFPIDFSFTSLGFHLSGCAYQHPGWALVSTYDGDPGSYTWMDDQVFAVELKGGGRVVRLAHTHSLVDEDQEHDYWAEPHASVNQDFTRILFTSNWGRSGTGEVDMYMIELPEDWTD